MFDLRSAAEWKQVWRYYQAGVVNALFGYGLYSLLIALHFNMYFSQAASHLAGMAFNYYTYSRYTFKSQQSSKSAFILSYAANYLIGLFFIWTASLFNASPYVAGLISIVLTSAVNYFLLRLIVFRHSRATNGPA